MSGQPTEPRSPDTWAPDPGAPAVLRLDDEGPGFSVRIAARTVTAAHETRFEKLIRTPTIWGSAVASLAVFVLVSTAFATGTVRPAPPRAPTLRPGEPTPTPDSRPRLSIGGFELQPPLQPLPFAPTPVPASDAQGDAGEAAQEGAGQASPDVANGAAPDEAPAPDAQPTPAPCTNLFGLGCDAPAPPPRLVSPRQAPRTTPPANRLQPILPAPSPAALDDDPDLQVASPAPPRGSNLEAALQAASVADDNFAREVDPASRATALPNATPARTDP